MIFSDCARELAGNSWGDWGDESYRTREFAGVLRNITDGKAGAHNPPNPLKTNTEKPREFSTPNSEEAQNVKK
jgi:hypothetical protein